MYELIRYTIQILMQFFTDYIYGFKLSNNGNFKINISAGKCLDSTGKRFIFSTSSLICDLEASGENGLDTGTKANNTWYYVYIIEKQDGTKASLLSLSAITPSLPIGYIYYRRVGVVYNEVENIMKFMQKGSGNKREYLLQKSISILVNGSAVASNIIDLSNYFAKYSMIKLQLLCNGTFDCIIERQSGTDSFKVYRKTMVHEYFYESPYYYGDGGSPALYVKVMSLIEEI